MDLKMRAIILGLFLIAGSLDAAAASQTPHPEFNTPSACNGYPEFCNLKYAEATFAATHNANVSGAYQITFLNQTKSLTQQLDDGIRALMLDIDYMFGVPTLCHGNNKCSLGWLSTEKGFGEIKSWLDKNPNEVVTLIFESYVNADDLQKSLDEAGLMDFAFVPKDIAQPDWSTTLGEMISTGRRLVIFTVQGSDYRDSYLNNRSAFMQAGLLYGNYYLRQSAYSGTEQGSWACDCVDGRPCNNARTQLYVVNHFITSFIGTGDINSAKFVNRTPSVLRHAEQCKQQRGRANFIAVDFYQTGAGPVVSARALNGVVDDRYTYKDIHACNKDYQCWSHCDTFCVKPAIKRGKAGCAADPNAFYDPIYSGTCWTCPTGYYRTWDPVTSGTACATSWFGKKSHATRVFDAACNKHYTSTSFWDPNGYCWDCEGYDRTWHPVTGWNACVEPTSGDPTEDQDIKDDL